MVGHFQEFEDEYLETMYEFHEDEPQGIVRTGELAARLGVSPASATEMVQRLATRGYLEYIPYKGARLTERGLVHGQKMKRRHRLAEVLLDLLPYEGNDHETACRLEHAIDDDMEVALSRLIRPDAKDPSGREIPPPTADIAERLANSAVSCSLAELSEGGMGTVEAVLLPVEVKDDFLNQGLGIGVQVQRLDGQFVTEMGQTLHLSDDWQRRIFITPSKKIE
ncbi:MAG: metal-dependent transcriptional regulator [Candidatus Poseidoniales archaeon]|nr:MAG: metal-dependent transcriptional regulator [Candidatus Poseidoniales archaeon]